MAAIVLAALGASLMLLGIQPAPSAPLPDAAISAAADQAPTGPETAEIADQQFTAADMEPNHLFIPAIGAYAPVVTSNVAAGALDLPANPDVLARWSGSAALGAADGNTLVAGHVTNGHDKGALFNMAALEAGEVAYLTDADGTVQQFQLSSLDAVIKAALPASVWAADGPRTLTIVTCGGEVTQTSHGLQYRDNIIAVFVPAALAAG